MESKMQKMQKSRWMGLKHMAACRKLAMVAAIVIAGSGLAYAQGILTVTPASSAVTLAGTGTANYSGDNGGAAAATLASPSAVVYDANGNLFIADANNHVVREVLKSGTIQTIAGTGIAGYSGDGGAATSADLDTPSGVAVDSSGNVYIADTHNNRIREVSGGTITTIAGTGVAGSAGDGGAATSAQLSKPNAIALSGNGNLYIADTNNNLVRKISGGTITTVAGNGEELYAGDGGAATAASLDMPTGVAVDAAGNIYIADRQNQRVRVVSPGGGISTLAGSGAASFAGGYSGDGASPTAASLAKPTGVSIDAAGNVYIADENNQAIRKVGGGVIETVVGSGFQGFAGDGGPAANATLNAPKAVALDASGELAIADTLNQRVRSSVLPTLTFIGGSVGVASAPQAITLANTGTAPITVSSMAFTGPFETVTGGTCSALPISLSPSSNCTVQLAFLPAASSAATGSATIGGTGVVPQTLLLNGTGIKSATAVTLTLSNTVAFVGQAVVLTAKVTPPGLGIPTGTASFYNGSTLLGTGTLTAGSTSISLSSLPAGSYVITAAYSGDTSFLTSTSPSQGLLIEDYNFTIVNSGGSSSSQTVTPGQSATYNFTVQPITGTFAFPVTLSATGLPPGATATFTPNPITLGTSPTSFTMTIKTASTVATRIKTGLGGGVTVAFLLLPFIRRRMRQTSRQLARVLQVMLLLATGVAMAGGLSGCGTTTGFFGQAQQTYNINVVGTATGAGGATLQHFTAVTLTIE